MSRALVIVALTLLATSQVAARPQSVPVAEDPALSRRVERIVARVLESTGTPSASVAVVRDGGLVLARAWGLAREEPRTPASADMRYPIASISKQFCAAAILLLAQEGKLSLDDKVARFLADVGHAGDVTIRQLLSHTAGYEDYMPQDYLPPYMYERTDVAGILDRWTKRPLDFTPGEKWQYSNTNYVIAGAIVEKVSRVPLFDYLKKHIFQPLGMSSVWDYDRGPLPASDATGYTRFALGPLHLAPKEASGWLFAAGELAMTARDLARWDLSIIQRSLLDSASYRQQETEVRRRNVTGSGYGLGVELSNRYGHRIVSHRGGVSGFGSVNLVFPDGRAAVVVMTNGEAAGAAESIANLIARLIVAGEQLSDILRPMPRVAPPVAATLSAAPEAKQVRRILEGLQRETLDRALFTDNGNSYFTQQALSEFASSLSPLGPPIYLWQVAEENRGGMIVHGYVAWFAERTLVVSTLETPDGRFEQYVIYVPTPPNWR